VQFDPPADRRYTESHEWARRENGAVRIGITDFAQDELGDVIFVELPSAGDTLDRNEQFGTIESIKAVSDLYAPMSGTVTEVNERLLDEPELVNEDPYGEALDAPPRSRRHRGVRVVAHGRGVPGRDGVRRYRRPV